jgi:heptosyltransferase-3
MHTEGKSEIRNPKSDFQKILLVRNDNIGDLVCSIPAIQLLRKQFPQAQLDLLVNSYNAPVVQCLIPESIDHLIVYHKTKHVGVNFRQLRRLFSFYSALMREQYDTVILLVGGHSKQALSFAKWSGAEKIYGYSPNCDGPPWKDGLHELEYSWNLALHVCGIQKDPPKSIAYPLQRSGNRIAIQITSRKPGNRWSVEKFVELARKINEFTKQKPILLWSPGDSTTLTHPGDDDKAAEIIGLIPEIIEPRPTASLEDLIQVFCECKTLITPDGGAMHLAAAMGIKIVAMFGQSDPVRWKPWTPHARWIQSPTKAIEDIAVEKLFGEFKSFFV